MDHAWRFRILDVFTDRPLTGNQLAVFEDAGSIPEGLLQPLAQEIGFSETVFVYPPQGEGTARIRIFTPRHELPFAGHPTLGTAVLIAASANREGVVLETRRGPIPVTVQRTNEPAWRGTMRQPIPKIVPVADPEPILQAFGVTRTVIPVTLYDNGVPHIYIMLHEPEDVAAVRPDVAALTQATRALGLASAGFNVFSGRDRSWKTRMFAPADGIAEDPATGSAAGPLALHLARHGLVPWETEIRISQGAEIGRPSELFARAALVDNQVGLIEVSGMAVPVGGGWFDANLVSATVDL